jgi:hypothetical protein
MNSKMVTEKNRLDNHHSIITESQNHQRHAHLVVGIALGDICVSVQFLEVLKLFIHGIPSLIDNPYKSNVTQQLDSVCIHSITRVACIMLLAELTLSAHPLAQTLDMNSKMATEKNRLENHHRLTQK